MEPAEPKRRHALPIRWYEIVVVANVIIVHFMARAARVDLGWMAIVRTIIGMVPPLLGSAAVGVLIRILVARRRGEMPLYLAALRSGSWWITTLRLFLVGALMTHGYAWLKLLLPVLTRRNYDAQLASIDDALLFGHSPSVLLVNVFAQPVVLHSIDFGYGLIFFVTMHSFFGLLLSHPSNRWREAYTGANCVIWISGVWLYYLVPSLGPAYRFPDIWKPVYRFLPITFATQAALLRNYRAVIGVTIKSVSPQLNVLMGIAAFPSLHVAFQTFLALWIRTTWRRMAIVGYLAASIVFLGSIVTGWHYLVDSIAGLVMAVGAYLLMRLLYPESVESLWANGTPAATEDTAEGAA
jgi:PAP2 superfamily